MFPRNLVAQQGPNDDLDTFLVNFERLALTYKWPRECWVAYLIPNLNAKAQAIHARLDGEDCSNYDVFKQALVDSFDLGPEEYKRKFRTESRDIGESFKDYGVRLEHLFVKWWEGYSRKPESARCRCGLFQAEMLEQYYLMIHRELQILLKDRCPKTLKKACCLSDALDRARDHMFSRMKISSPQSERPFESQRQDHSFVPAFRSNNFSSSRQSRPFTRSSSDVRFQVPSYRPASSHVPYERNGFCERIYSHNNSNHYKHRVPFQQNSASARKYCNLISINPI